MNKTHLQELITPWFEKVPDAFFLSAITASSIGILSLLFVYLFTRRLMLPGIQKVVTKLSPERIGSLSPMLTKLNKRIACLLCLSLIHIS